MPLNTIPQQTGYNTIEVIDGRLDDRVFMNGITYMGGASNMLLDVQPKIHEVIKRSLQSQKDLNNKNMRVVITALDIKDIIGFAIPDKLSCLIESKVFIENSPAFTVSTFARNDENMSPGVITTGKLIVDLCLAEHTKDLIKAIKAS